MNPKAANVQTLQRLDQLEAGLAGDRLTVDDIRNTIHQVAAIVVELSQTIPAILAELRSLAELIAKMTAPEEPPSSPSPSSPSPSSPSPSGRGRGEGRGEGQGEGKAAKK